MFKNVFTDESKYVKVKDQFILFPSLILLENIMLFEYKRIKLLCEYTIKHAEKF